ncbi:Dbl homology domain-containing protein [Nemania serpens]|nr:Dbl homology domain-containing protein [Nemania serpens]
MDPLSITTTVIGLTATCLQTAKALNDIKDKYQNAQLTISAIVTEATIISASLSRIQTLILGHVDDVNEKLKRPDLETTLDIALTGCFVVFNVLETEVRKLTEVPGAQEQGLGAMAKIRFMWSESTMQDLLRQIRGLQTALILLLQLLETESIAELKTTMDNNTAVLSRLVERTKQLRISRGSQAPESIFDMSFTTQSIRTSDQTSIISSTFFTFDDELVNAPVYRRTLARAYAVLKMEEDTQQTDSDDVKTITGEGRHDDGPSMNNLHSGASAGTVSRVTDFVQMPASKRTPLYTITPTDLFEAFERGSYLEFTYPDWLTLWDLRTRDVSGADKHEIERQAMLREMVTSEINFMYSLWVLEKLYRQRWMRTPGYASGGQSDQSLFPDCDDICEANQTLLLGPMLAREVAEGPWVSGYWDIFHSWLVQSANLYVRYTEQLPRTEYRIRTKAAGDPVFSQFLQDGRQDSRSHRLEWNTYVMSPIVRFQRYIILLSAIRRKTSKVAGVPREQLGDLDNLIESFRRVNSDCDAAFQIASDELQVAKLRASCDRLWGPWTVPEGSKIHYSVTGELRESAFPLRTPIKGEVVIVLTPKPTLVVLSSKIKRRCYDEDIVLSIQDPPRSGAGIQVKIQTLEWVVWFTDHCIPL